MISTTLSSPEYLVVLTKDDFLHGAAWNHSITRDASIYEDKISRLQVDADHNLKRLDVTQCIHAYNHEFVSDYRNVLLISDIDKWKPDIANEFAYNGSVFDVFDHESTSSNSSWFCRWDDDHHDNSCVEKFIKTNVWPLGGGLAYHANRDGDPATIHDCLAEKIEPQCKVTFNVFMLFISTICNAAKAAAFIMLLLLPGFQPLITIGDAIASFLTRPDAVTATAGAPAIGLDGSWKPPILSQAWEPQRCRYCCGATLRQWLLGTFA